MSTKPDARPAWAAAALGVAATVAVFWPGLMSVDSAGQYAQALGLRRFDDVVPPLMTLAWGVLDRAWAGPGAMFIVLVAAWWGGIAALCGRLPASAGVRVAWVLAIGFFPATFLMLGHVWKDVAMAAALAWAVAAIGVARREPRTRWRMLALSALALACAMRVNAIFAVLPLLAWLCWPVASKARAAATFVLLAAALAVFPGVLTHAVRAQPTQAWTVVALWDLAALSIAADRVLIPPEATYAPITVEELRGVYLPYANPPLFDLGKIQVSLYVPYSPPKIAALQAAWRQAVLDDPLAYLAHRAHLSRYLLFGFPAGLPRELVYVPERLVLPGTPYAPPAVDTASGFWRAVEWLRPTPLFAGAVYLALGVLAAGIARGNRGEVFALAGSSWANALPLLFISGSAEFRYLAWTVLAALLAFATAIVGRRAPIG